MEEYNSFGDKIDNREFTDFSTDDYGGYGILDQLGIKNMGNITWINDEDDFKDTYNKLIELRESKQKRRHKRGGH